MAAPLTTNGHNLSNTLTTSSYGNNKGNEDSDITWPLTPEGKGFYFLLWFEFAVM